MNKLSETPTKKQTKTSTKTDKSKDDDSSVYYFFKQLDESESKNIVEWLIKNSLKKDKPEKLRLFINSPGGCLYSALAIVDIIQNYPVPVQAYVTGCAASAASLIFSACHSRVMTKRSFLMTHQYSSHTFGKYHEIKSARAHEDEIEKEMVDVYVQTTKLTESVVRSTLLPEADVYLSAKKAKELNICDAIV
jgi:ATP-dependent protease ClpP protease subunit